MSLSPPDGLGARPLASADAEEAAELLFAFDSAYLEEATDRLTAQDLLDWWRMYDLGRESIAVRDGGLVALGLMDERDEGVRQLQAFVHPDRVGLGLEAFVLDWAEQQVGRGGTLRTVLVPGDESTRHLVESRGYWQVRSGYRMLIDLHEPPPPAVWPEGFGVAALAEDEQHVLYEVIEEAFAEEWSRPHRTFEDWQRTILATKHFDPTLCFLVRTDDQVAAAEMCQQRFGMGFVGSIGVRKKWRRLGLGRALLRHGFAELYARGERRIGLGVDAGNPTGATRLYESVGMRVAWQADTYERVL